MSIDPHTETTIVRQPRGVAGAETVPAFGVTVGRDLAGRILPPLCAVLSVIAIWWLL